MAEFVTGDILNDSIIKIIEKAKKELLIVSPYIRIHDRVKAALLKQINNHKLSIKVLYGKNEKNKQASLTIKDFEFLRQFPNIRIKYESRLHAKFYSNESDSLLTSMNLLNESQNINIEAGVFVNSNKLKSAINTFNIKAGKYFNDVFNNAEAHFIKLPQYKFSKVGIQVKYLNSVVTVNEISDHTYDKDLITGFCIRTGKRIPFNVNKPYSYDAYSIWQKKNNKEFTFPEKFCHFSGKLSKGKTSFSKPILYEFYGKAMETFGVNEKNMVM